MAEHKIAVSEMGMNKALDYAGINYGEPAQYAKPEMPSYPCCGCGQTHSMSDIGFITERPWEPGEEANPTATAGMNLYCAVCAHDLGLPTAIRTLIVDEGEALI